MAVGINSQPILPGKPKVKIPKGYKKIAKALNSGPKKKYGTNKYANSQRMK
jgi:hypothetical protein